MRASEAGGSEDEELLVVRLLLQQTAVMKPAGGTWCGTGAARSSTGMNETLDLKIEPERPLFPQY